MPAAEDPPPVLADHEPRYAELVGLGDEYEVAQGIQVLRGPDAPTEDGATDPRAAPGDDPRLR